MYGNNYDGMCWLRLNMAMNEDRLYVLSANPHYAVPEESKQMCEFLS